MFTQRCFRRESELEKFTVTGDHTECIIEIVRHATRQPADSLHLLCLPELLFQKYAIDSYIVARARELRPSRLGRYNGILYFVPPGGDIAVRLGGHALRPLLTAIVWLLVASTLLSMGERLFLAVTARRRRAPASPDGETRARPPR